MNKNDADYNPDNLTEEEMLDRMNELIKRIPELMIRLGLVADGRQLLGPIPQKYVVE